MKLAGAKLRRWIIYFRSPYDDGFKPKSKEYAKGETARAYLAHFTDFCHGAAMWDQENHTKVAEVGSLEHWRECCDDKAVRDRKYDPAKEKKCRGYWS
jgi:hypothetical protein